MLIRTANIWLSISKLRNNFLFRKMIAFQFSANFTGTISMLQSVLQSMFFALLLCTSLPTCHTRATTVREFYDTCWLLVHGDNRRDVHLTVVGERKVQLVIVDEKFTWRDLNFRIYKVRQSEAAIRSCSRRHEDRRSTSR